MWKWARHHPNGYECSSKGDRRFSAFRALLQDGRSIECHYQCDIKGYNPGSTMWRLGKGKPSLRGHTPEELYKEYLSLWQIWSEANIPLMRVLYTKTKEHKILTDCYANSPVNQARALCDVMNSLVYRNI